VIFEGCTSITIHAATTFAFRQVAHKLFLYNLVAHKNIIYCNHAAKVGEEA
jgi:hypothetical protein